ncbi:MAG: CvpA family protein [Verrucomicrobiota bacterium]
MHLNYVDFVIMVVLILGIFRGRKRGMSEELLTFVQWLIIILAGAKVYEVTGKLLAEHAPFSLMACNLAVYLAFAILVKLVFSQIQRAVGEKLVGSNFFGESEYYLGMLAAMVRFGCVILMLMAVLNARLITDKERADTARMQQKNFEGISFPTFGSVQQSVLYESLAGQQVKTHLAFLLIRPSVSENIPLRPNENRALNEVLGTAKR